MQGLFKCMALGKSPEKSKSGKFHYLFINGDKDEKTGLFMKFYSVDFWSEIDIPVVYGKVYNLVLDFDGEYIRFVSFES